MATPSGMLRALSAQSAWQIADQFDTKTNLIDYLVENDLGFRRTDMFKIIGNIWERKNAPLLEPDLFRFDRVPTEYMAELDWSREDRFGIMGYATYEDELGNPVAHRTVFWTDDYSTGQEYEQEWGMQVAEENRYPGLRYIGFEVEQVWHKKGADYGHPMLQEI